MSFDKMKQSLNSIAKAVDNNQKLSTELLSIKLAKYTEAYPYDQTLGSMSQVINQMVSNKNLFIRKADLKDLYTRLYSRNTKFASLFSSELGEMEKLATPTVMNHDNEETEIDIYDAGDPILLNALNSMFDKSIPLKSYSEKVAIKALKSINATFDAWGLKPNALSVDDGNEKFIVAKADFETPKGITSFYVPVETNKDVISNASLFMGNSGVQALNNLNIKSYITSNAGQKLKFSADVVLNTLVKVASAGDEINDVELALAKLNNSRKVQSPFFQNQVVGLKVAEEGVKDVQLAKYEDRDGFEEKLSSPYGVAAFNFGDDKIKIARDSVSRDLVGFGYKNHQITVVGSDDTTVLYGVSLDGGKVAFTVPVKITNGKVSKPSVLLCNGSVASFNKLSINDMYVSNQTDYKIAAAASPLFGQHPGELVNTIRKSIKEGNHAAAEDALNVLASTGDQKAYAVGFNELMSGLAHKTAEVKTTCSHVIKTASSQHPVCGHTGLPLHKVYQDKHGDCRPLYRKNMSEDYEGATFSAHKILG